MLFHYENMKDPKPTSSIAGVIILLALIYITPKIGPFGGLNYLFLFSLLGFYGGYQMVNTGKASLKWPVSRGIISKSSVRKRNSSGGSGMSYSFEVEYEFQVDGSSFVGSTYSYKITTNSANSKGATALVEQYPLNSEIDVYYNPVNPKESVLLPGLNAWSYMPFFAGLMFLFFGIALVIKEGQQS